jgi:uncharacterized phiE125 gp8 family phage protein
MPSSLIRITPPTALPLSLAEAKAIARLDYDLDAAADPLIAGCISAATDWVEQQLGKALISQTWAYSVDGFPCGYYPQIRLPLGPVQSIDEVVYVDIDGLPQTLASSGYVLADDSLWPAYGTVWPTARAQPDAVVVTYVAGFGPDWNSVPEAVRHGIATLVQAYYDGCSNEAAVLEIIRPFRAWAF